MSWTPITREALQQEIERRTLIEADLRASEEKFRQFAENTIIRKEDVLLWLGEQECILIIDELNLVEAAMNADFASFLKDNFLVDAGRALVFSSHVISTIDALTSCMHTPSERTVVTKKLPLAQSLAEVREAFEMPTLSPHEALYMGQIPALIYCSKW